MHAAAHAAWYQFITTFEGDVPHMYLDDRKLVRVGIGTPIDSTAAALELPFQFKLGNTLGIEPGTPASREHIESEWTSLKYHPNRELLALRGPLRCARLTQLELGADVRQHLFERASIESEARLVAHFPEFPRWPADAQLALLAMARSVGKRFPRTWEQLSAACRREDFRAVAHECRIPSWRPERNEISVLLFHNAARILASPHARNAAQLYYPEALLERQWKRQGPEAPCHAQLKTPWAACVKTPPVPQDSAPERRSGR
ncbi:MAG TPA: hypothetical protein VJR89_34920 [Polyangiales bacterium]|nr:hypothetical protein [Polyangiales bacterium]